MAEIIVPSLAALREYEPHLEAMMDRELDRHLGKVKIFERAEFRPDDPRYAAQRLDVVGMTGTVGAPESLRVIGRVAFGDAMDAFVDGFEQARQTLADVAEGQANGERLLVVTTHQRTDDVAAALGALLISEQEFIQKNRRAQAAIKAQLFISKLITGLDALGQYVPNLLAGNLGDQWFTLPPSRSMRESIPHDARVSYNDVIEEMVAVQDEEAKEQGLGVVRCVAANGSTFVHSSRYFGKRRDEPRIHAAPLAHGTIAMMRSHHLLPIAIDIDSRHPGIIIQELRPPISAPSDSAAQQAAHDIMHGLMEDMERLTGKRHRYHETRDSFADATRITVKGRVVPIISRPEI